MTPAEKLNMVLVNGGLPELTEGEVKRAHRYMRLLKAGVIDTIVQRRDEKDKNGDLRIMATQIIKDRSLLQLVKDKLGN